MSGVIDEQAVKSTTAMRIAVEGCGHGTLDAIYASIQKSCAVKGWDGVDLVIIGGDFQAVRDRRDLNVTAMPAKYRDMADFHQYYWGTRVAPYLTIFIGGNHEASNHLFELYYGGWVAPNIYYLGAANVIQIGPLKIAGMSGIWKGYDYRKPHYERLPYSSDDMYSIYHVREIDVRKLLAFRSQVDIGMSHDWPKGIEWHGDHQQLFKHKPFLKEDAQSGKLGNAAAQMVMDRLRPAFWFSAHLHTRYTALKSYNKDHLAQQVSKESMQIDTKIDRAQRFKSQTSPHQEQLSAWNNFSANVHGEEAKETSRLLQEEQSRREEAERSGVPVTANYRIEETYKKIRHGNGVERNVESVTQSEDYDDRQENQRVIPQLDGCCTSVPLKRRRESSSSPTRGQHDGTKYASIADAQNNSATTNPDAIDIEMSDDEETTQLIDNGAVVENNNSSIELTTNERKPRFNFENGGQEGSDGQPVERTIPQKPIGQQNDLSTTTANDNVVLDKATTLSNDVSEEMRAKLAALSSKFEEPVQVSASLPHPEDVKNTTTRFLALSKCEDRQNFLQLLEIEAFESPGASVTRPIKIQYVSEWLAILRAFASELTLGGSPKDQPPGHKGDTYYRDRIIEEEKWIEEHVVKPGHLTVPEGFAISVADYTSEPTVGGDDMPREVTNPQTSAFCNLIGIDNPFDISEQERDARMAAGPAESASSRSNRNDFGSRGGRGGRGGGHGYQGGSHRGGRGRGNRGRGGRGRGRN